jgi:glycine hydroxymethyltransferase
MALARPGDTIIAPATIYGSHPSVRPEGFAGAMGLTVIDLPYIPGTATIDLDALRALVRRHRPRLISIGTAKVLFADPVATIAGIAAEAGANLFYDGAHLLGLIAGHGFDHPLAAGADVLTGSTQKTLPGPIGGMVLSNGSMMAGTIARATSNRLDNYQNNRIAALGYVLAEMLSFGPPLAHAVVETARKLGAGLADSGVAVEGADAGFTDTHMLLVDLTGLPAGAQKRLESAGILATETLLWPRAGDTRPRPALRLGSSDIARAGYDDRLIGRLAGIVAGVLRRAVRDDAANSAVQALLDDAPATAPRYLLSA